MIFLSVDILLVNDSTQREALLMRLLSTVSTGLRVFLSWQTLKPFCILYSSCMWFWGGRPRQALRDETQARQHFSNAALQSTSSVFTSNWTVDLLNCIQFHIHRMLLTKMSRIWQFYNSSGIKKTKNRHLGSWWWESVWPVDTPTFLYLMTFSMQARWRKSALTTGAWGGTSGALQRKLSRDRTLWNDWKDESSCVRNVIRWHSSVRMTRSRMMGLASRESWIRRN